MCVVYIHHYMSSLLSLLHRDRGGFEYIRYLPMLGGLYVLFDDVWESL